MSLRPTMKALVDRLRQMLGGDLVGGQWSDTQLQLALDIHRAYQRQQELRFFPTRAQGGMTVYLSYDANGVHNWEDGPILQNSAYATVEDDVTFDARTGVWTFTGSVKPPLYATGYTYDLSAAAVDLLTDHLGFLRMQTDAKDKDAEIKRSQRFANTQALIKSLQARAGAGVVQSHRSDISCGGGGW